MSTSDEAFYLSDEDETAIPEDVFERVILPLADFATLYRYRYHEGSLRPSYLNRISAGPRIGPSEVQEQLLIAVENDDPDLFDRVLRTQRRVDHSGFVQLILNTSRLQGSTPRLLRYLITQLSEPEIPMSLHRYSWRVEEQISTDPQLLTRYGAPGWCRIFLRLLTWRPFAERSVAEYTELVNSYERRRREPHGGELYIETQVTLLAIAKQLTRERLRICLGNEPRFSREEIQVLEQLFARLVKLLGQRRLRLLGFRQTQSPIPLQSDTPLHALWRYRLDDPLWYRTALATLTDPTRYNEVMALIRDGIIGFRAYLEFVRYRIDDPEAFVDALIEVTGRMVRVTPIDERLTFVDELLADLGIRERAYAHRPTSITFSPEVRRRLAATLLWWLGYYREAGLRIPWFVDPTEVASLEALIR